MENLSGDLFARIVEARANSMWLNERNGRIRPPVTGQSLGTVWVRPKRSGLSCWKNEGQMAFFESSSGTIPTFGGVRQSSVK
jgi:hypothetical protein